MRQPLNPLFLAEDRIEVGPRMVIVVGFPRTGKSTWVRGFVADALRMGHSFTVIGADDVRRALKVRYDPQIEDQVRMYQDVLVDTVMMRRQHVLIDNTNLTKYQRDHWIAKADANGYGWGIVEIECLEEEVHKEVCRRHDYPWSVIEAMKRKYEPVGMLASYKYTLIEKEKE